MRFLRRRKKLSAAMLVVLIVVIGAATLAIRFVASFSPVPLVISKETTYITKPLRSDGTPDYVRGDEPAAQRRRNTKKQRRRAVLEGGGAPPDTKGLPHEVFPDARHSAAAG